MNTPELVEALEKARLVVSREHGGFCDCPLCDAAERLAILITRLGAEPGGKVLAEEHDADCGGTMLSKSCGCDVCSACGFARRRVRIVEVKE